MRKRVNFEPQKLKDESESGYFDEEKKNGKAMMTPLGVYDVDDSLGNPYKIFDIYMGHTNFLITPEVVNKIKDTPGVELLQVITPYRFMVAPGKLFDWQDVGLMIQKRICTNQHDEIIAKLDDSVKTQVGEVLETLKGEDFWRMYIFPNGNIHYQSYRGLTEYEAGKKEFIDLKKASSGEIITSD